MNDIEYMIGSKPHAVWRFLWKFVAPFFVLGLLIVTIIKYFLTTLHYQAYDASQVRISVIIMFLQLTVVDSECVF